ncbi:hypothetical protein [Phaeovulum sp. NW3]|uniref:hypothetical protein n=1 Tax=Phaeovulum sp. NW3 TaxID=2934933 RepID=UPI00202107DA|nr:hypothetical protein [Phaeovulum sp. NW3]MCL7466680.1 hypothetical protein [Phaeovulum sp. NW3]
MTAIYRDLRYLRLPAPEGLDAVRHFALDKLGLQLGDVVSDEAIHFRSDMRNYALAYWKDETQPAIGLTVARREDLDARATALAPFGAVQWLDAEACRKRQIKAGIAILAPNGVMVEIVWRPLTSGWRYHGTRDAGITEFGAVSLACTDLAANETFWTRGIGAEVADWAGDALYLNIDAAHHRIALYPSRRDGVLAVTWEVESINNIMQNWYFFQNNQIPVIHGPGRQAASNALFVLGEGPDGVYYGYRAETAQGLAAGGPRQFLDDPRSHCAWGSESQAPEFRGGDRND